MGCQRGGGVALDCDVVAEQSRFGALVNSIENLASMAISQRMVECEHHSAHGDKGLLLGLMRVEVTSSDDDPIAGQLPGWNQEDGGGDEHSGGSCIDDGAARTSVDKLG